MDKPQTLSPLEVCTRLNISRSTLHRWAIKGILNPVERWPSGYRRYSAKAVNALAEQMGVNPLEEKPNGTS
jgi:DNA-binding transcriptional MerR regulator